MFKELLEVTRFTLGKHNEAAGMPFERGAEGLFTNCVLLPAIMLNKPFKKEKYAGLC